MTHALTYFEHVPLPDAMPIDDLSTGVAETSLVDSIGGVFDYFGSVQRLPRRHQFVHKGRYVGEVNTRVTSGGDTRVTSDGDTRVTAANRTADLFGKVDDLKSMIGKSGQVWRERIADGQMTWKQCRLLNVRHEETVENAEVVSDVESMFETAQVGWRSEDAVTTAGSASSGVPLYLLVPNAGSLRVDDAILRVACTSGNITSVSIVGDGIDITWTGNIANGNTLVIDAGEQTPEVGSTDAYSGFTLNEDHTSDEWLPLAVGTNLITVTVTGGGATVSIEHFDQWP